MNNPNPYERFVWPWTMIVANIFGNKKNEPKDYDRKHWLRKFELYKPKDVPILHSGENSRRYAWLKFAT